MYPEAVPNHVNQIKKLKDKVFDGLKFHRVIPEFMVQTGDPLGNGTGGSGNNLKQNFQIYRMIGGCIYGKSKSS